jgi:hypothetical protein
MSTVKPTYLRKYEKNLLDNSMNYSDTATRELRKPCKESLRDTTSCMPEH